MLDLTPDQVARVRDILRRRIPDVRVLAFGSRAAHAARRYSDLDLALETRRALPLPVIFELEEDFSMSDLPFHVDIVDMSRVDAEFRRRVLAHSLEVQPGGAST
jgi:predicted nucleotidyltransferase